MQLNVPKCMCACCDTNVHVCTRVYAHKARCIFDLDERLKMLGGSMRKCFAERFWPADDENNEVERERRVYGNPAVQRALCDGLPLDGLPGEPEQTEIVLWGLTGLTPESARARRAAAPALSLSEREAQVASAAYVPTAGVTVAFLQGDGGSGKSRTLKRLTAELRSRGQVRLAHNSTRDIMLILCSHASCCLACPDLSPTLTLTRSC